MGEIDMYGLVFRYLLIEPIRIFDRTVLDTGRTTFAFVLQNIPGLPDQRYVKISGLPLYPINFGIGQDLYVGMPADLDQLGSEYSDGAVISGKGLVKLGHVTANGRRLVDQINLKTRRGQIKRGLNTADPSTDNHHISEITAFQTWANLALNFFHFSLSLSSASSFPTPCLLAGIIPAYWQAGKRYKILGLFRNLLYHFLKDLGNVLDLYSPTILQS